MANSIKAVLTVIALCVLASPARALEKVWYCEMTSFVETNKNGSKRQTEERFKFKVTRQKVVFGSGGYFDGAKMDMTNFQTLDWFIASDPVSTIFFSNDEVHFAKAEGNYAHAISARCEEF